VLSNFQGILTGVPTILEADKDPAVPISAA
jgi:hypothetical protein